MKENFKKSALLTAMTAVFITGCSNEESPSEPVVNEAPSITLSSQSLSVDEGDVVELDFNVVDDTTSYENMTISVSGESEDDVSVDKENKKIFFTARWLSERKVASTSFNITASDSSGMKNDIDVSVNINDIDEVVSTKVTPPSQGFGYENTQTDSDINIWIFEGQDNVVFSYEVTENDGDALSSGFALSNNEVVFENDVEMSFGESGSIDVSFNIPEINTPSENFILQTSVEDNDGVALANANITVVNEVNVSWNQESTREISEENGGLLIFDINENEDYSAEMSVYLTDENGEELGFELPYEFNPSERSIRFNRSPGFLGDRNVVVNLSVSNEIGNGAGEFYKAETVSTLSIIAKDDRDDGFFSYLSNFNGAVELFNTLKDRDDELRVASSIGTYLLLKDYVQLSDYSALKANVSGLVDVEIEELSLSISEINAKIDAGESADEIIPMIDRFASDLEMFGSTAREQIRDFHQNVIDSKGEGEFLPVINVGGGLKQAGSTYSHYVGNDSYGYFVDETESDWEWLPGYNYLAVANVIDVFCF